MGNRGHHHRSFVAAGVLLAVLASLAPAAAPAADPSTVAIMVHLMGGPSAEMPASAAELRATSLDILAGQCGARGIFIADRLLTGDLVRRHLVRTGSSLTPPFLTDLRDVAGAGSLLAVAILSEGGRVAVGARLIDTTSGHLIAIGLAEAPLTGSSWQAALTDALRRAFPTAGKVATGPNLLVLPARVVGMDPQAARAATGCVLAETVISGHWSVIDPAIVAGAMVAAGRDLNLLDSAGRALLAERCGVTWAVVIEVVSFNLVSEGANSWAAADAFGWEPRPVADLSMTLQLLDLRTGLIRSAVSVTVSGSSSAGWFGVTAHITELDQIRSAAGELWTRFERILEEQTS